jgi:hypothetical protein
MGRPGFWIAVVSNPRESNMGHEEIMSEMERHGKAMAE